MRKALGNRFKLTSVHPETKDYPLPRGEGQGEGGVSRPEIKPPVIRLTQPRPLKGRGVPDEN